MSVLKQNQKICGKSLHYTLPSLVLLGAMEGAVT